MAVLEEYNLYPDLENKTDICLFSLDSESKKYIMKLASKLREEGIVVELDYINNTMKQQFKLADRCKCKFIGIIGETERENNTIAVKNTKTGTQENIDIDKLINYLKEN